MASIQSHHISNRGDISTDVAILIGFSCLHIIRMTVIFWVIPDETRTESHGYLGFYMSVCAHSFSYRSLGIARLHRQ